MTEKLLDRYFDVSEKLGGRKSNWKHYFSILFEGVNFQGSSVLDVGGGIGRLSYFAAAMGAKRVTLLEPESDGSQTEVLSFANQYEEALSIRGIVEAVPIALQDFLPSENCRYDLVIFERSINHLDEEACRLLRTSKIARESYERLFRRIYDLMNEGGRLLIVDCSNRNLFGDLGVPNPFAKTINWEIHQAPEYWSHVLEGCGFKKRRIVWLHHNRIRGPIRKIFGTKLGAYLYQSMFLLDMTKE